MKWFKKKSKTKSTSSDTSTTHSYDQNYSRTAAGAGYRTPPSVPVSKELLNALPSGVLERIFAFVCPHTQDVTYESCEQSAVEDTCMLCDLRDLSHCAQTCRTWRRAAYMVMFHSIRIDAVHYCNLEDVLAEKRKRRSFLRSNAEPEDTPAARLRLLYRTLHEDKKNLSSVVQYLKVPYMTRETCKADLARVISLMPNLRYCDLPEGVFTGENSCLALTSELQARCPDIRKMAYMGGSERSLEQLGNGILWRNLEVIELSRLRIDPTILRHAIGSLPQLRALKVTDMPSFNDDLFQDSDYLPPFPALDELIFDKTPNITTKGICNYLKRYEVQDNLRTLIFTSTGVHPSSLQQILELTPRIVKLSLVESITTSFPATSNIPLLASRSLRVLHYEISVAPSANAYASTVSTYYSYLASSLIAGRLPGLHELYVRDPDFPELLLDLAPPPAPFASSPESLAPPVPALPSSYASPPKHRFSSNNPFQNAIPRHQNSSAPTMKQELEIYSKGLDEMEWIVSKYVPPKHGRRASATAPRPVSSYGLSEGLRGNWDGVGGARKSVIVGNGFGGFLSVPGGENGRPSSSHGEGGHRRKNSDLWR